MISVVGQSWVVGHAQEMPHEAINRTKLKQARVTFISTAMPNGGVDAAARIQSSIAGPVIMRNTPPPLASNDLLGTHLSIGSIGREGGKQAHPTVDLDLSKVGFRQLR